MSILEGAILYFCDNFSTCSSGIISEGKGLSIRRFGIGQNQELNERCTRRVYDSKVFLIFLDDLEEVGQCQFQILIVRDAFLWLIFQRLGECIVPTIYDVVRLRNISGNTIVNVPQLMIEEWFLLPDSCIKKI